MSIKRNIENSNFTELYNDLFNGADLETRMSALSTILLDWVKKGRIEHQTEVIRWIIEQINEKNFGEQRAPIPNVKFSQGYDPDDDTLISLLFFEDPIISINITLGPTDITYLLSRKDEEINVLIK